MRDVIKSPSQKLHDLLSGRTEWDDADASIRSWARLDIHKAAIEALRMPKEKRDAFIERIPRSLQDKVKAEANRIWLWHKQNE